MLNDGLDDTTTVGLITDNDETIAYREEVRDMIVWCQDNNVSFNVSKTKEMIVDYRKRRAKHLMARTAQINNEKQQSIITLSCEGQSIWKIQ